jgi:peptidoglycan/xylan/chitin deacetylase (PgdA/CDA1 family)
MAQVASRTADWVWHKDDFEKTFGMRQSGRFAQRWPKGVRLAAVLTFDTQGDVDAAVTGDARSASAAYMTCRLRSGNINYCDLTMRQYDVLEGVPRVLRILRKHGVRATFPTCGMTADWYPDMVKSLADEGHEVAAHGYFHAPMDELSDDEERQEIERATEAISRATGIEPHGWRCPMYTITTRTLEILRDLGYTWNSDFHDQDFPYVLSKDGRTIVEIPAGHDDWNMYLQASPGAPTMGGTPYGTADGAFSTMKAEFDMLYEEGAEAPRLLQWCMHPKISGRAFRANVLDRLLEYMKQHDGVWFATCSEIAALA